MQLKTDGKKMIFSVLAGCVTGVLCALVILVFLFRMRYQAPLIAKGCLMVIVGFLPILFDRLWKEIVSMHLVHVISIIVALLISLLYVHAVAVDAVTSASMDREVLIVFVGAIVIEGIVYFVQSRKEKLI